MHWNVINEDKKTIQTQHLKPVKTTSLDDFVVSSSVEDKIKFDKYYDMS